MKDATVVRYVLFDMPSVKITLEEKKREGVSFRIPIRVAIDTDDSQVSFRKADVTGQDIIFRNFGDQMMNSWDDVLDYCDNISLFILSSRSFLKNMYPVTVK